MKNKIASQPIKALKTTPLVLKENKNFVGLLTLAFLVFGFIGIMNHEMWLDELQAWDIARDSPSISALFKNLKYEGHPGLWYLGLYLINKLTRNPVAMQLLHLIIATAAIYVFTKFSPFTKLQKIVFSFGYFPFYEYALISRNYSLGVLLIFCFCALYPTRKKTGIFLAGTLFLLFNTNIYSFIIAVALTMTLIFEYFYSKRNTFNYRYLRKSDLTASLAIVVIGVITSLNQMVPASDYQFGPEVPISFKVDFFARALVSVAKSYLVIPNLLSYQFWNTSIFTGEVAAIALGIVLSLGLLIFSITVFFRKPVALFLYSTGTFGMLLFMYLKYFGSLRHNGHLFILFIACLWISSYYSEVETPIPYVNSLPASIRLFAKDLTDFILSYKNCVIMTILYIHLAAGIYAFTMDLYNPFSETKEVANFIKTTQQDKLLLVADIGAVNYIGPPLSAYLEKKIYYISSSNSGLGSFTVWNNQRGYKNIESVYKLFQEVSQITKDRSKEVLLVLEDELETCQPGQEDNLIVKSPVQFGNFCLKLDDLYIAKVKNFTNSMIRDEKQGFYLYSIQGKTD